MKCIEHPEKPANPDEIAREFRDLLDAAQHLLFRRYEFKVTAGDWKQFKRDVKVARKFMIEEVDGERDCLACKENSKL